MMKAAHWPRLAGALLCLFVLVSPLLPLDGVRLALLLLLLGGELWFSRAQATMPVPPLGGLRASAIWLPWLLWGLLSCAWSFNPSYSFYYWTNEMLFAAALFALGLRLAQRQVAEVWVFAGLAAMTAVLGALSAAHLVWPAAVPLYLPGWLDNQPQATVYLVWAQVAAIWWLIKGGRSGWTISLLTLLCIVLTLWVAGKRAPYLAQLALCVLPLLFLWRAGAQSRVLRRLSLVLAVFAVLYVLAAHQLVSTRSAGYKPGVGMMPSGLHSTVVNSDRYEIWRFWLQEARSNLWLGTGAGRFLPLEVYVPVYPPGYDPWALTHAHNIWLNQTLQLGIPGLLFFSLIWLLLIKRFARREGDENCQYANVLRALAISALLTMLIRNGTDDLLFGSSGAAWWLLIAFLYQRSR